MPNPLEYSRRRRLMLQVVMTLVLGGTIGLAAIIRQVKVGPSGVPLSRSLVQNQVRMHLPAWHISEIKGLPRGQECIRAIELNAASQPTGRVLECRQEDVPVGVKPDAFLMAVFRLPAGTAMEPMRIAGSRGVPQLSR